MAKCIGTSTGSPAIAEMWVAHSADEAAGDLGSDWWRQIDRWVNEGGAEKRMTAAPRRQMSRNRKP